MKQETLEEAIDRYYDCEIDNTNIEREHFEDDIKELMIYSANQWQQERSYSEGEVLTILHKRDMYEWEEENEILSVTDWFKQFKKK